MTTPLAWKIVLEISQLPTKLWFPVNCSCFRLTRPQSLMVEGRSARELRAGKTGRRRKGRLSFRLSLFLLFLSSSSLRCRPSLLSTVRDHKRRLGTSQTFRKIFQLWAFSSEPPEGVYLLMKWVLSHKSHFRLVVVVFNLIRRKSGKNCPEST